MGRFRQWALAAVLVGGWAVGGQAAGPAPLLELGLGARALGMGGAFVSLIGDADALGYNPAALAYQRGRALGGYVSRPFDAYDHLALGLATESLGLSLSQIGVSGISQTNHFGTPVGRPLSYVARAAVAGFGVELAPGVAFGAQWKAYFEDLGPLRGFGWALDPALLFRTGAWSLGAVLRQALGEPIAYDDGAQVAWPARLTLGGSWRWADGSDLRATLAADLDGAFGLDVRPRLGAEVWLGQVGVRLGWDAGMLTAGASVERGDLRLHWAYAFHDTLPQTLRLSASVSY